MSREESNNTTPANHVGPRDAVLGRLCGKATSYRFRKRENWKTAKATKRRPRIVSSCRGAALIRLIIPPLRRDRWFKSSPRNQFLSFAVTYRVYVFRNREGKFYVGLSQDVGR